MEKPKGPGRGWPAGKPRVKGGPVVQRLTIGLTSGDQRILQALAAEWECSEPEAARRSLMTAFDKVTGGTDGDSL